MPALDRKTSTPPRASRFQATEFGAAKQHRPRLLGFATARPARQRQFARPSRNARSESQLGRSSPCDHVGATFESGRHCDARPPRAHAQVGSHTHVVTVHIRSLTAEDVDPLTAALAEAFRRDDLAIWIFPDQRVRDGALAAMFRSRLSEALHDDETVVDVADDLSGAAIWQSPRVRLDDNPPPGARPERRGVGSALMGVGLRRLDTAGVPSALMTGAERNLVFYRKHGYRELRRFDFRGASAWWMW